METEDGQLRSSVPCADINWNQCLKDPGFWVVVAVFLLLSPLALVPVRGANSPHDRKHPWYPKSRKSSPKVTAPEPP
jgi:hypothetical protein